MLPYIGSQHTKKKPNIIGSEQLIKQWSDIKKQLQAKSKQIITKITTPVLNDFNKICKLKEIPQFYCYYLLLAIQKLTDQQASQILSTEIVQIINYRSYFHKINQILQERPIILKNIQNQLQICQGFQDMNLGKSIKANVRSKINQLLKQATTLQDIKDKQKKSIYQLATYIIKLRNNTLNILQNIKIWRQYINNISPRKIKNKIIFPIHGFNCIVLCLFDSNFIYQSFLSRQFIINQQNNPFVMIGKKLKRKNQFNQYFQNCINQDSSNYEIATNQIIMELKSKYQLDRKVRQEEQKVKDKQKQENKIKWLREIKQRSKIQSMLDKDNNKEKQKQKQKKKQKNQQKNKDRGQSANLYGEKSKIKDLSLSKNGKSLIDIQSILLKHKSKRKKQQQKISITDIKQQNQKQQQQEQDIGLNINIKNKKIMNIYGNKTNQQLNKSNDKIKQILNQKIKLQKQLKQAKLKNKQFQKLIKKIQKSDEPKINKKQQNFNNKNQLRIQPITNNKQITIKTPEQDRVQFKNKVEAVYKSRHARKINNKLSNKQLQNSTINVQDLLNDKRSLQKQLKSQIKQKQDLQRLIKKAEKQSDKKLQNSRIAKSALQQKIQLLQSKIQQNNSPKNSPKANDNLIKSKASIISAYVIQDSKAKLGSPITNLYESKLVQQKHQRMSVQKQMRQIIKQKNKLEQTIQKSQNAIAKQKQIMDKKIQKYEQTIQKLKQEHNQLKLKKSNAVNDPLTRQKSQSLRMYTTTPMKNQGQQKKQKSLSKTNNNIQSANYFKLPPEVKKAKLKQKIIVEKDEQQQNGKQIITSRKLNQVQIIQTKKTIEIIYESNRRNKSKANNKQKDDLKQSILHNTKTNTNTNTNNEQLQRIKKQKQNLLYKLQRQQLKRQQQQKAKQRKAIKQQGQLNKYKQIIQRQRQRKIQLQNKLKTLKRQLYDQYDQKLKNEKLKFQQQKRQLLAMVQNQKSQKQLKQKYLNNQIKFFKQMQANQNQLIKLLQSQKRNRIQKQKQLAIQIAKKQQLLQIIQIQQIKKGIQSEIRMQLQNNIQQQEEQQQIDIDEKKEQLRMQIQQMNQQRNQQLKQIDDQNQKLKQLIARIKNQQGKLLNAIKQNIGDQSQQDQYQKLKTQQRQQLNKLAQKHYHSDSQQKRLQQSKISKKVKSIGNQSVQQIDIKQAERMFQSRLKAQQQHQNNMHSAFKKIRESPQYQQKEQVQNLIQMYLKNPHQYPASKKRDYSPEQKGQIQEQVLKKSKMAGQFERQLLQLKQVQKFVPTAEDDIMTSHLLNLKRVYQQKQSSALKQQLFPALKQQQKYHHSDLSFQSQQTPPPKTIRQHVQFHAKNFPIKKSGSKNFLTINRMRVAMLQQNRKDKQKLFIEQQAKRRAQAQILKKNLRAIQQQRYKKSIEKRNKFANQQQALKQQKNKKKGLKKIQKQKSNQHENVTGKTNINKQIIEDQYQQKFEQTQKQQQQQLQIDKQKQKDNHQDNNITNQQKKQEDKKQQKDEQQQKQKQQVHQIDTNYLQITNKHSSLDRQKKQLEQDVYSYQEQIRSFVSRQDKYQIYQQFIQSSQLQNYIKTLFQISSKQIKGLNNNQTIFKDIHTYKSVLVLIAKDKQKQVQVGIGIFHKQFQDQLYVCDYVLAHNMRNFLNLLFNFSRFIFKVDLCTNKIEFFFDLNKLEDQISIIHFIQFQEKCKRMGQVYVKIGADKARKYALRRNLFQPTDKKYQSQGKGIQIQTALQIHSDLMKQSGYGYKNSKNTQYLSITALLSAYLKKNEQQLAVFRKSSQQDLRYRQLLLTALMFQKKQVELKNCQHLLTSTQERLQISKNLKQKFVIQDPIHQVQHFKFSLSQLLPEKTKRCTFNIDDEQINYIITFPQQAITKIQSSNSSQTGLFLNLIPKYKMLIIQANQFLNMNQVNPEINVFFYIKHFVKNIVDVRKQQHSKVFLPEFVIKNQVFLKDLSAKMKMTVFAKQNIKLGWNNVFSNSVIFNPSHKDLVIKKPFIISLMSAAVERVIQGTPLCATLID